MTGLLQYVKRLMLLTKVEDSEYFPLGCSVEGTVVRSENGTSVDENTPPILSFQNPILKSYLADIYVETVDSPELGITDKVFREITQWHNAKAPIDPKHHQKLKHAYALTRNQRRMAATVGNPMEFKAWPENSQETKGFKLEMVFHSSRYSDLRKFIYFPPKEYNFDEVKPAGKLPVPGIEPIQADAMDKSESRFAFIHPIASLTNRLVFPFVFAATIPIFAVFHHF